MNQSIKNLLGNIDYEVSGELPESINKIKSDSRLVEKGDLFVAIKGLNFDGHTFLPIIAKSGASVAVVERFNDEINLPQVKVANSKEALLKIANNFYEQPTDDMTVIGVTGTNGKTTTTYLIQKILMHTGHNGGIIGTYGYTINNKTIETNFTTPDIIQLFDILYQMKQQGVEYVIMEVSSHAIAMQRIDKVKFDGAVFTNISRDHLDFHKTLDKYAAAKAKLFEMLPHSGFALINQEDDYAPMILKKSKARNLTYSVQGPADYYFSGDTTFKNGIQGRLFFHEKIYDFSSLLSGTFNMNNLLAAIGVCHNLNIPMVYILNALRDIAPPPGRLEEVSEAGHARVFIDYAHTPDAIENALRTLKNIVPEKGQLISIFGCGGNRDQTKRPLMAKASEKYADLSILTTDNPRFEVPQAIINEAKKGFSSPETYRIITDRAEAIRSALSLSKKEDIIAILGKGHETYQDIEGDKFNFDDKAIVREFFNENK